MRFTGSSPTRSSSPFSLGRTLGEHFDALEPRRMLRGATQTLDFDDPVDDDVWRIQLSGPGSFVATPGTEGLRLLALTGTTVDSSITIGLAPNLRGSPASRGGNGELRINLITGGTIGSITADPEAIRFIAEDGQAGSHGIALTNFARSISIGDLINGSDIVMSGTNPQNRSSISIRDAFGANVSGRGSIGNAEALISSNAVIDSFSARFLFDATINAARIGTIDVTGGNRLARLGFPFPTQSFDITTTSTTASFGVKTINVNGSLTDSTWTIASRVQRIVVNTVFIPEDPVPKFQRGDPGELGLDLDVTGRVDVLNFASTAFGTFDATSFGSINVGGFFDADLTANGAASNITNSIDSLRAPIISGSSITATNGIGLLNVGRLQSTGVQVGWLGFFNVTGTPGGDIEDFFNSDINLNNTQRNSVLFKMNVQGVMNGSSIIANNNLGDLTLRGMLNDSIIRTGAPGLVSSAAQFTGNFKIDALKILPRVGGGVNFANSVVSAAVVGSLILNLRITTANGAVPFGLSFDLIQTSTYTLFANNSAASFASGSGGSGAPSLIASSGDFVLRNV